MSRKFNARMWDYFERRDRVAQTLHREYGLSLTQGRAICRGIESGTFDLEEITGEQQPGT